MQPAGDQALDLRDYLLLLRRRRWVIAVTAGIMALSALAGSLLQTNVYTASAKLLVQPTSKESALGTGGLRSDPERLVATEIEVLKSAPVQQVVEEQMGGVAPKVSARPVSRTDVVIVSTSSSNPARAAQAADAYARAYIDYRRRQAVEGLLAAGQDIQQKLNSLNAEVAELARQAAAAPPDQRDDLRARRDGLIGQQGLFRQRLDTLDVEVSLKSGGAVLVTPAKVPTEPVSPQPLRATVLALMVGAIVGVGLALLWEYLDDTLVSRADVESVTAGLPVLGLIPFVETWRDRKTPFVVSLSEPHSTTAEAFRSLRTAVQFMSLENPLRILQVTSAGAGEGKTSMVANLGITLARAGQRVVLVCCDLRRPRLMTFFGIENKVGLTSVLMGEARLQDAIQAVGGEDRLYVLPAGPRPPNPSEMLSNRRTFEVFAALQEQSDIVIIDSPPMLPVTDASIIGARVDATILLAAMGTTTKRGLARAYELLRQVDATVIGTVLNGASQEDRYGYGYGNRYGYGYGYGNYSSRYVADDDKTNAS